MRISTISFFALLLLFKPALADAPGLDYGVRLVTQREAHKAVLTVDNQLACPITLSPEVSLTRAWLVGSLKTQRLPPRSQTQVFVVRGRGEAWSYRFKGHWRHGDFKASHKFRGYRLPYETGRAFKVIQGPGGALSHRGAAYHAIDFAMPVGTKIYAARAGTVVFVTDAYKEGGLRADLKERGNVILIGHSDGTIANYGHLKAGGAKVKRGQAVKQGQLIGLSGNTGYSGRPHLHFEVYQPVSGKKTRSLRILFKTAKRVRSLRRGHCFKAVE